MTQQPQPQPRAHSCSASAFRALALLDVYEQSVREIPVGDPRDRTDRPVAVDLQSLVCCCAELPELAVPFMELLLSHRHLIEVPTAGNSPVRERHREVGLRHHMSRIRQLRRSCRRYLSRGPQR